MCNPNGTRYLSRGIPFTPILPILPEIGKQFQPFVSISNLIQPAIDQRIAEYGLEMAQRKLKTTVWLF
jgi:hypothetical protein